MLGVSVVKDFFSEDTDLNTALSQVTSLAMSDTYYLPPGTAPPMVINRARLTNGWQLPL